MSLEDAQIKVNGKNISLMSGKRANLKKKKHFRIRKMRRKINADLDFNPHFNRYNGWYD